MVPDKLEDRHPLGLRVARLHGNPVRRFGASVTPEMRLAG